ncbi:hypothetical protein [Acinetobacter baumannii]|uniref:hypothetical protein n=1 Tax=Acinetobacter baumannii TaxID=470 RepID=UPI00192C9494|nr:hypothetical protein [Acinetobacter baumannii]
MNAQVKNTEILNIFADVNFSAHEARNAIVIDQETIKAYAKQQKVTSKAVAVQLDIANAIINRMNNKLETENKISSTLFSDLREACSRSMLNKIDTLQKAKFDLSDLATIIAHTDKSHIDFVQVKVIRKIFQAITAIAENDRRKLDGYTMSILLNLLQYGSLTVNECRLCCTTEIRAQSHEKKVRQYYLSAASSQASSSRMTLRALNICNVVKSVKDSEITFNENSQFIEAVLSFLQMKENTQQELERVQHDIKKELSEKQASA